MLSECALAIVMIVVFIWCVIKKVLGCDAKPVSGAAEKPAKKSRRETAGGPRDGLSVQKELEIVKSDDLAAKAVSDAVAYISEYDTFAPLDAKEQKHLEAGAKKLGMSVDQLVAMRHVIVSQKIAGRISDVIQNAEKIYEAHSGGKSMLDIANDMKYPPLAVARQILLKDHDMQAVRAMLSGEEKLPAELDKQVHECIAADHGGEPSMEKIMAEHKKFEKAVAAFLKKSGVEFETEEDLKKSQTADPKFGKPVATPDFFFKNPIKINGKLINWLEIRNYPMFDLSSVSGEDRVPKIIKNVMHQSSKYNRHFGSGAFVFRGIQPGVVVSDAKAEIELIDGSSLAK